MLGITLVDVHLAYLSGLNQVFKQTYVCLSDLIRICKHTDLNFRVTGSVPKGVCRT